MEKYISNSYEDTVNYAKEFAKKLKPGGIVAYLGGLGAGKTAFTTGLAIGLGIQCDVTSPTFSICNEYIYNSKILRHYDMYRISNWDDLYSTGYFDNLNTNAYTAIEWAENIYETIPDGSYIVEISIISESKREIKTYMKGESIC